MIKDFMIWNIEINFLSQYVVIKNINSLGD